LLLLHTTFRPYTPLTAKLANPNFQLGHKACSYWSISLQSTSFIRIVIRASDTVVARLISSFPLYHVTNKGKSLLLALRARW
jgi:hypothetical protein